MAYGSYWIAPMKQLLRTRWWWVQHTTEIDIQTVCTELPNCLFFSTGHTRTHARTHTHTNKYIKREIDTDTHWVRRTNI